MFCKVSSTLFFAIYFLSFVQCFAAINERCGIQGAGICKPICSCQLVIDILNKGEKPKLPVCGFENEKDPLVCCYPNHEFLKPNQPSQRLSASISQTMCNEYYENICQSKPITIQSCRNKLHNTNYTALFPAAVGGFLAESKELPFMRICKLNSRVTQGNCKVQLYGGNIRYPPYAAVGGLLAKPKELPFMGLVGYLVNNEIDWSCGCSLISDRFVLSAGHCTKHPTYGLARVVRLGELDYSTKDEKSTPFDYKIIKHINHPEYKHPIVYNDIALYKLDYPVIFTDFIRPICLPNFESFKGVQTVFGAGWGRTDFVGPKSSALIKVNLDYLRIDQCSNTVDKTVMPRGLDNNTMICSGVLAGGRDTCSGDSGGPLFLPPPEDSLGCHLYTQLGITSFGKNCAVAGIPGVYTNVLPFVPWIESIVWPINKSEPKPVWSN